MSADRSARIHCVCDAHSISPTARMPLSSESRRARRAARGVHRGRRCLHAWPWRVHCVSHVTWERLVRCRDDGRRDHGTPIPPALAPSPRRLLAPPCWPSPGLLPGLAPCLRRRRRLLPTPSPLTAPDPAKSATWPPQSDNEDEWGEEETPKAPAPKVIMVGRVIKDYIPEKVGRQLTLLLGTAGPPSGRRSPPPAQHPLTRPAAAARPCARACRRAGVRLQQGVARGPRLVGGTLPPPRRRSGHVATSLSGRLAHASPTPSPGRDPRRAGLLPARVHRGGEEVTPSCFRLSALYNCTRTNTHHAGGVQLSWPRRRRRRAAAGCATPPATPPAARTPGVPSSGSLGAAWWAGPP